MIAHRKLLWGALALTLLELLAGTRLSEGLLRHAWSERDNHLFNNGQWTVGKDEGRFVFYTYDYMFDPLKDRSVDLNARMGYQQLFHRTEDSARQRLDQLSFGLRLSNRGYTWIFLHRNGEQRLGIRLSRQDKRPAGVYRFDADGVPTLITPLPQLPVATRGVPPVQVTLARQEATETWTVRCGENLLGTFTDPGPPGGQIGFGGNGYPRSFNLVSDITFSWRDGNRTWTTRETFQGNKPSAPIRKRLWIAALIIVGLRLGRRLLMSPLLPADRKILWWSMETVLFLFFLAVFYGTELAPPSLRWILALVLAEAFALGLPLVFRVKCPTLSLPRPRAGLALLATTLPVVLLPLAAVHHGGVLFTGKQAELPQELGHIDPAVFIRSPDPSGNPATLTEPARTIRVGEPWFSDPHSFRDQEIKARFRLPANTTLDLLFQQQSYLSRGDPDGEAIPMQRRLIRFSTHPDVSAQGLAQKTGRQPNPFRPFVGTITPDTEHQLTVRVQNDTITLTLDDQVTTWDHTPSLGFGATGWMTWEHPAELLSWSITPLEGDRSAMRYAIRAGIGLLAVPLLWLVFLRQRTWCRVAGLSAMTLWPLTGFTLLALMTSPDHLPALGPLLPALFSGASLTALFSATALLILLREHLRKIALLFNLLFVLLVIMGAVFVWNGILPADHPIKVNLRKGSSVTPGDLVSLDIDEGAPWYAANRSIGANIYVWRQAFAGERVPLAKPEGTLRVFHMGGSQAWGSGAASTQTTVPALLEQALDDPGVQIYNAAINGSGGSGQRIFYEGQVRAYQPDILIIDNGLNDTSALTRNADRLPKYLGEFEQLLQACKADGVSVIWMAEPMSEEAPLRPIAALYEGYRALVEQYGFVAVDERGAVTAAEQDRFVWWDTAHLAPYGQRLLARQLEPHLREVIAAQREAKK